MDKKNEKTSTAIGEWLKNNNKYNQYYCESAAIRKADSVLRGSAGLNCSDVGFVEKEVKEYQKKFFKEHILRKATPEELEWIEKQPKVDLDSREHEHLKPILAKLIKDGWL